MTPSGIVGVLSALAFVLGLMLLAVKLLRRFGPAAGTQAATIPMQILRRMPIGPRQAIAVVRIDTRVLAVSVGDGGVRVLSELDPSVLTPTSLEGGVVEQGSPFGKIFKNAVRNFGIAMVVLASAAASVQAQATRAAAPTAAATTQAPSAATAAQAARPAASAARIDSLLPRLAPQMQLQVGAQGDNGLRLSGTVGIVVMMGLLTLLPMLVLMMTGFTRILIVMHFLRQAIGAQSAPPQQLVAGLSLLLTLFVMTPTLEEVNKTALTPWMDGQMEQGEMLKTAVIPFRTFMFSQVRDQDVETFLDLAGKGPVASEADVPTIVLTSAFVTSELRTAFQVGFALFLPFIVIDIVVASVLMSVGMMMVPPAMIALPFKLLLFVLVDGWTLVIQGLVQSFA